MSKAPEAAPRVQEVTNMPRFFSILLLAGALFCSVAQSVYSLERMAQRDTVIEEAQTGHAAHFLPAVLSGDHA